MTVEEMLERMSSAEITMWRAHDELTATDREKAQRQADKGMRPR
jgi:hypothetical protein